MSALASPALTSSTNSFAAEAVVPVESSLIRNVGVGPVTVGMTQVRTACADASQVSTIVPAWAPSVHARPESASKLATTPGSPFGPCAPAGPDGPGGPVGPAGPGPPGAPPPPPRPPRAPAPPPPGSPLPPPPP